jgi:hypothetical protein
LPSSYDYKDVHVLGHLTDSALFLWKDSIKIGLSNKERNEYKKKMSFYKDLIRIVQNRSPSSLDRKKACDRFWYIDINDYDISRADKKNLTNLHSLVCRY